MDDAGESAQNWISEMIESIQHSPLTIEVRYLLEFVKRWLPFGGPTVEDVLVDFGLIPVAYPEHVRKIVVDSGMERLD